MRQRRIRAGCDVGSQDAFKPPEVVFAITRCTVAGRIGEIDVAAISVTARARDGLVGGRVMAFAVLRRRSVVSRESMVSRSVGGVGVVRNRFGDDSGMASQSDEDECECDECGMHRRSLKNRRTRVKKSRRWLA